MLAGIFSISIAICQDIQPTIIYGIVVDANEIPVELANVQLLGTMEGASTGVDGRFEFLTNQSGQQSLLIQMLGFEPVKKQLLIVEGDSTYIHVILQESVINLDQLLVTTDGFSTGESEGVTIRSLDVVTTAGAAADILLALKTFPGISMVDEGAGLFVRGGDLGETLIIIDQATLSHPYKFESPTGGVFGIIPPFLIDKTTFSTGGFSVKYGNALSGVLDMSTQNMPKQQNYTANLGIAAASLGAHVPLIKDKVGVRLTGNRSSTKTLFRINGQYDQFSEVPQSSDLNLSLIYDYSSSGSIKMYSFLAHDQLGVYINFPSFDGTFRGKTSTSLSNIQWTDILRKWFVQTGLSISQYTSEQQIGYLNMKPSDVTIKIRTDAEKYIGDLSHVKIGFELEKINSHFQGTFPIDQEITTPTNNFIMIDETYGALRAGSYAELLIKLNRQIVLNSGIRTDYYQLSKSIVIDPRISLRYVISKTTDLRLAWGIYHQFASPFEYNSSTGNPHLGPQYSQHFILGFNHQKSPLHMRIEAYYKPYYNLVLRHSEMNFNNGGKGRAGGFDIFTKYGSFLQTPISGWLSYSYNRSVRLQPRNLGNDLIFEFARTPFEIQHNLTVVAKTRLIDLLYGGITMRYATGRPVTPVISSVLAEDGSNHLPVEGSVGSERLPSFQRLDFQLIYYLPFGDDHNIIFYLALGNALNRPNVLGLDYSSDYSERTERVSNYRRFLYFGASISLNR